MSSTDSQLDKATWRRGLLQQRQSLPADIWQQKSTQLCSHLQSSSLFAQSQTIVAYFSFRQEPDLSILFSDDHRWGFPRCAGKSLSWHLWKPGEALETGSYGLIEPPADSPTLQPAEVDLILVPAVACDEQGYRLGYGGGFYDRLFSSPEWASTPALGIVFEFAYLPQLPIDSWDKQLHGVCTEMGIKMMQ